MTTHLPAEALSAWVDGTATAPLAMSVEQHLSRCPDCRGSLTSMLRSKPHPALPDRDLVWGRIEDAVTFPATGPAERAMVRAGLPEADATLVGQSPSVRLSWWWSLAAAVLFALLATAMSRHGWTSTFLMLAPVVPVAGVALAYGPAAGVQVEQVAATPYPALRLVLLRAAAVLVVCVPVVVLAGLALPEQVTHWWLLPAGGFTAAVLGLSSWVRPATAAGVIIVGWVVAVSAASRWSDADLVLEPRLLALYGLLLVVGPLVLVDRTRRLGTIGRISP